MIFWALMLKEWRILLRDKHALAVLFVMPALFLLLMAMAMANINQDRPAPLDIQLDMPADDSDSRFFQRALAAQLTTRSFSVRMPDAQGVMTVTGDSVPAAAPPRVELPTGFSEQLLDDAPAAVRLVFPPRTDGVSRQRLRGAVEVALAQTRLMAFLLDSGELDAASSLDERLQLVRQRTRSHIEEQELLASGDLAGRANATQQNVPAWLIFGMFFVMLPMANSFQREQQNGTLLRLRCLRLGLPTLALSKLPAYFAINLLQFVLLLAIGVWGLPQMGLPALELPGSALAYWLLAACLGLTTCSLGLAMAALARSTEQALLLSGGLNIILAAIGGIMVPKSVMPDAMRQLAELSPMSWALDAFLTLLVGQGSLADIAPYCARLLLFAAIACILGLILFHRRLSESQWTTHS
ncbi:MAG: ABC transporter permease [Pseudomonadota bacterium]